MSGFVSDFFFFEKEGWGAVLHVGNVKINKTYTGKRDFFFLA